MLSFNVIFCQFWNTVATSIFEILGHKLEVLLSIFCGTKITLKWITPPPPPPPPLINVEILSTLHYSVF